MVAQCDNQCYAIIHGNAVLPNESTYFFFIDSVVFYILYLFDNVVSCSWYRRHREVFICFFVLLQHVVITQWLAVWMSYYYMCVHAKYRNQKVLNKPTIWKQTFLAREGPAAMRRRLQLIPRQDRAQCSC